MNGIIVIDKPQGKTSHDVVREIKKTLGAQKVGHTGTLDPLATGVLPVCINEGTKLAQFCTMDKKEYRATMLLGVQTDTYDVEGKIVAEANPCVTGDEITRVLGRLVGSRQQTPPAYSAVKFRGKPLYAWARQGISISTAARPIEIYSLVLEQISMPYVIFRVSCSKGTYIRSLCAEIGEMLGCGACLAGLRRLKSGNYTEDAALPVSQIEVGLRKAALEAHLITMADALPDLPSVHIDEALAEKIRRGYQPDITSLLPYHIPFLAAGDMLKFIDGPNLVAIAKLLYGVKQFSVLSGIEQAVRIMRVFKGA